MKRKKIARIGVVLFALSMLTGYVVYSQLQQTRKVASSSKLRLLKEDLPLGTTKLTAPASAPHSNTPAPLTAGSGKFFPGSKSVQVFAVDPSATKQATAPSQPNTNETARSNNPQPRP